MTIVHMSEKGQIVVPKDIRDKRGFRNGSTFSVRQTRSGASVFRPVEGPPRMDLVDHLLDMKGIEIPERHMHCPPRL